MNIPKLLKEIKDNDMKFFHEICDANNIYGIDRICFMTSLDKIPINGKECEDR